MISVLLSWIYIGILCLAAGTIALYGIQTLTKISVGFSLTAVITAGIVLITVYAEYWSIFYKVGAVCHLVFLVLIILATCISPDIRNQLFRSMKQLKTDLFSWAGLCCLLTVLLLAFATSRGTFHTDTRIYHAQAIRMIEEYGLIKGQANLQLHFGYNSAYLVFCAFFTGSWILPQAMHTTTGFLAAVYAAYCLQGIAQILRPEKAAVDIYASANNFTISPSETASPVQNYPAAGSSLAPVAARFALLIYIFTNFTGLMSPATDYGTMMVAGYLVSAWLDAATQSGASNIDFCQKHTYLKPHDTVSATAKKDFFHNTPAAAFLPYCLLCVLALFTASMKLSAAFLVLLVIFPLYQGLRSHQGKVLQQFLLLGFLTFLPYLIRNVLISGWLFYPVTSIDLFPVAWKVPAEYARIDQEQITVWGRCLYDVTRINDPLSAWLPIWWEHQEHYEQLLIYANILAVPLLLADLILALLRRKNRPMSGSVITLVLVLYCNLAVWFFSAPFIRYGLIYLLNLPLLGGAISIDLIRERNRLPRIDGLFKMAAACLGLLAVLCFSAWIDHYGMDDLVFLKHNLAAPYYVWQEPFENPAMGSEQRGNNTIYYATEGENNSYYVFPSTCYKFMLDRSALMGERITDGFRAE